MSGFLNVIPLASGASYTVAPPADDYGNDGDYALDLNSNILYGPKDSTASVVWPVGPTLGGGLRWYGQWSSYIPASGFSFGFTTGQVVHDGATPQQQYLCVKPHTVNVNNTGPYIAGDLYTATVAGAATYYRCIQDTSVDPITWINLSLPNFSSYWFGGNAAALLAADSTSAAGAGGNWQALSPTVTVNDALAVGSLTNFVVKPASIGATQLASNAVTTVKIADSTGASDGVTTSKLATNAVTTAKITDANVTTAKIADGAITTAKLASSSVTGALAVTVKPTSDGDALTVQNSGASYFPFKVNTSSGTTTVLQGFAFQTIFDGTASATFKSSDGTSILVIDTTNKQALVNVLSLSGALSLPYRAITAARTLDATDHTVNCTSGTFTVTLPTAVGITGRIYFIKNSGTGTITVGTTSSQTIDGTTTKSLSTQYSSLRVQSNGANWIVM